MFKLSKWYLDVITEDGSAFIGYAARLEWGPLRVAYGATLLALSGAAVIERVTLRPTPDPREAGDEISWACPPLGVEGSWRPLAPPVRRRLFEDQEGAVDWDCRMPAATVEIQLPGRHLAGLGYALRVLAQSYAGHPGYRAEWRPRDPGGHGDC